MRQVSRIMRRTRLRATLVRCLFGANPTCSGVSTPVLERCTVLKTNRMHPLWMTDETLRSNSDLISRRRFSRLIGGNEFTGHTLLADEPVADRKTPALLPAPAGKNPSAILVGHACAEPVGVTPLPSARLVGTLHQCLWCIFSRVKPSNIRHCLLGSIERLDFYASGTYFASLCEAGIAQVVER